MFRLAADPVSPYRRPPRAGSIPAIPFAGRRNVWGGVRIPGGHLLFRRSLRRRMEVLRHERRSLIGPWQFSDAGG